ncbi:MAG TPA: hypothetical protein DCP90_03060 [Clostridiales bacterium]|nr:MAG: hypothetical protein A2Y22_07465 [Clostridiales bacterium GWD2_32_59]HAN09574.1 hypothetical protein [Clostridiales bacterium]
MIKEQKDKTKEEQRTGPIKEFIRKVGDKAEVLWQKLMKDVEEGNARGQVISLLAGLTGFAGMALGVIKGAEIGGITGATVGGIGVPLVLMTPAIVKFVIDEIKKEKVELNEAKMREEKELLLKKDLSNERVQSLTDENEIKDLMNEREIIADMFNTDYEYLLSEKGLKRYSEIAKGIEEKYGVNLKSGNFNKAEPASQFIGGMSMLKDRGYGALGKNIDIKEFLEGALVEQKEEDSKGSHLKGSCNESEIEYQFPDAGESILIDPNGGKVVILQKRHDANREITLNFETDNFSWPVSTGATLKAIRTQETKSLYHYPTQSQQKNIFSTVITSDGTQEKSSMLYNKYGIVIKETTDSLNKNEDGTQTIQGWTKDHATGAETSRTVGIDEAGNIHVEGSHIRRKGAVRKSWEMDFDNNEDIADAIQKDTIGWIEEETATHPVMDIIENNMPPLVSEAEKMEDAEKASIEREISRRKIEKEVEKKFRELNLDDSFHDWTCL